MNTDKTKDFFRKKPLHFARFLKRIAHCPALRDPSCRITKRHSLCLTLLAENAHEDHKKNAANTEKTFGDGIAAMRLIGSKSP
jgi:hypothetical protein